MIAWKKHPFLFRRPLADCLHRVTNWRCAVLPWLSCFISLRFVVCAVQLVIISSPRWPRLTGLKFPSRLVRALWKSQSLFSFYGKLMEPLIVPDSVRFIILINLLLSKIAPFWVVCFGSVTRRIPQWLPSPIPKEREIISFHSSAQSLLRRDREKRVVEFWSWTHFTSELFVLDCLLNDFTQYR